MTYSLLSGKVDQGKTVKFPDASEAVSAYLGSQGANLLQISRIYLLVKVLEHHPEYFIPKVANLIQVADTGELETFLKFLILLPHSEQFKDVAVEALRTNIATVFDAIALNNPYPSKYFNDQQWNQMYLKAAFMQRDLLQIIGVEERANADLARIISDYAHERWAASRPADPLFWRPVGPYLNEQLLEDMRRLLERGEAGEQMAGYLCCRASELPQAAALIKGHELSETYRRELFDWKDIK